MISFENDYIAGAHPKVLEALVKTNMETLTGYGSDIYCERAKEKIREACGCPYAEVEFIAGGTQTNMAVISAMLRDYEGVIAAKTGHISVHEAGAIEYTGHEVLEIPQKYGKIDAKTLKSYVADFYANGDREHMVFPGMVYISQPTEYGTLYKKCELEAIRAVCEEYKMPLFIDGARLGYGLASRENDVTLQDMAKLADVFYIGGTKVGALCGEAVVFTKGNRPAHFMNSVKKRGALLAKGRLLGVQFDALFTDGLYFEISRHAIEMTEKMVAIFKDRGYEFLIDSPTNQQFVILNNEDMAKIGERVRFCVWEKVDEGRTAVRFACSWSTTDADLEYLKSIL